jgi:hypothetical protein
MKFRSALGGISDLVSEFGRKATRGDLYQFQMLITRIQIDQPRLAAAKYNLSENH